MSCISDLCIRIIPDLGIGYKYDLLAVDLGY